MLARIVGTFTAAVIAVLGSLAAFMPACCPVASPGKPVVNADQTVILLWDAERRTQHFIRKASFQSEADNFGFIVPSPTQPDLAESGNEAFAYLEGLTEPEVIRKIGLPVLTIGCMAAPSDMGATFSQPPTVRVLDRKEVAGYDAVILETNSSKALTDWLKQHGFAFSPEVQAWAQPYIDRNWKFTALKVAKKKANEDKAVVAPALRISFKTDRPLFPYREPDPKAFAKELGAKHRVLRIYFLAEARYRGELTKEKPWTGKTVWAGELGFFARKKLLDMLQVPGGPETLSLTEFEDEWPYEAAPADVYFSRDPDQGKVRREPIVRYAASEVPGAIGLGLIAGIALMPMLVQRWRQRSR